MLPSSRQPTVRLASATGLLVFCETRGVPVGLHPFFVSGGKALICRCLNRIFPKGRYCKAKGQVLQRESTPIEIRKGNFDGAFCRRVAGNPPLPPFPTAS